MFDAAHHLTPAALGICLLAGAVVCYAAFVLYGARIDGRRQKVRDAGRHPVTTDRGDVRAREDGTDRDGE